MAQQASFTVFDGAATPVSHTMTDVGVERTPEGLVARWREQNSAVPLEAQIRYLQILSQMRNGMMRTVCRFEVPVMESISGQNSAGYTAAPKVAYVDRFELVGLHHPRSTTATKMIGWQMLLNRLNSVATSVTPVTGGPAALLSTQLSQVT